MRRHKTRDWLALNLRRDLGPHYSYPSSNMKTLRLLLQHILEQKWNQKKGAKAKRIHRGINYRGTLVGMSINQHKRRYVIFQ